MGFNVSLSEHRTRFDSVGRNIGLFYLWCPKALKKYISVDFIVQCVLLEHVMPFSYYAKTQRELKHMD